MESTFSSVLQKKYIKTLTLVLIPFVLFTVFIIMNIWNRVNAQESILQHQNAIITTAENAMTLMRDGNNYLVLALLLHDPSRLSSDKPHYQHLPQQTKALIKKINLYSKQSHSVLNKTEWQALHRMSQQTNNNITKFLKHFKSALKNIRDSHDLMLQGKLKAAQQKKKQAWQEVLQAEKLQNLVNTQLEKLTAIVKEAAQQSQKQMNTLHYESVLFLLANAIILVLLMNVFSWYFIKRYMVSPITRLANRVNSFGQGELNVEIPVETNDEIGQLAKQFNKMRNDLQRIMVSKDYVDKIITSIPDSLIILNSAAEIVAVNKATSNMLHYQQDELIGKNFGKVLKTNQGNKLTVDHLIKIIKHQRGNYFEQKYLNKKGRSVPVLFSYSVISNQDKEDSVYLCVAQDLTEYKRIEEEKQNAQYQLQEAQKMESVGQLAGGVAHDFNNLLGGVLGYAQLAKKQQDVSAQTAEFLNKIIKLIQRAAELTAQLLAFARKSQHRKDKVNLNEIIQEAYDILTRSLDETIQVNLTLADNIKFVLGDSAQILQILINLGINAQDAMQGKGGVITFASQQVKLDQQYCRRHPELIPGEYIKVTVTDTGAGIPKKLLSKVFEPFFTTKPVGKGTGLGLSMAYGIMQQHGGIIEAESTEGKGTMFALYFPVQEKIR